MHSSRPRTSGCPGMCQSRPGRWAGRWGRVGSEKGVAAQRLEALNRARVRARPRRCRSVAATHAPGPVSCVGPAGVAAQAATKHTAGHVQNGEEGEEERQGGRSHGALS